MRMLAGLIATERRGAAIVRSFAGAPNIGKPDGGIKDKWRRGPFIAMVSPPIYLPPVEHPIVPARESDPPARFAPSSLGGHPPDSRIVDGCTGAGRLWGAFVVGCHNRVCTRPIDAQMHCGVHDRAEHALAKFG